MIGARTSSSARLQSNLKTPEQKSIRFLLWRLSVFQTLADRDVRAPVTLIIRIVVSFRGD